MEMAANTIIQEIILFPFILGFIGSMLLRWGYKLVLPKPYQEKYPFTWGKVWGLTLIVEAVSCFILVLSQPLIVFLLKHTH